MSQQEVSLPAPPPHRVVKKRLSAMKDAPYNPRIISDEAVAALAVSMREFGYVEPIVWNKRTGNVVGGHQRRRILMEEGVKMALTIEVDLPLEEEKVLNLALNNQNIAGVFTEDLDDLLDEVSVAREDLYASLLLDRLESPPLPADTPPPPPDDTEENQQKRTKAGVTFHFGDYKVHVSRAEWEFWIENIRQSVGFDRDSVVNEILRRLNLETNASYRRKSLHIQSSRF